MSAALWPGHAPEHADCQACHVAGMHCSVARLAFGHCAARVSADIACRKSAKLAGPLSRGSARSEAPLASICWATALSAEPVSSTTSLAEKFIVDLGAICVATRSCHTRIPRRAMSEVEQLQARLRAAEEATATAEEKIQRIIDLVKRAKEDEERVSAILTAG